jgi:hypothetical protein
MEREAEIMKSVAGKKTWNFLDPNTSVTASKRRSGCFDGGL